MEQKEIEFVPGFVDIFANQPDFKLCTLKINPSEFTKFLEKHANEDEVKIQVMRKKNGSGWYMSVDKYKKQEQNQEQKQDQNQAELPEKVQKLKELITDKAQDGTLPF